ncbi:GNAT family N-acetyltransferase [Acidihalobacter ferrooxydans]|uniref:L-ornithine N(alpha)-acyltransferase n=1 Tax=Acidihalobacter ferrooxydans TaxID=1765967 RepID=A0A1P8UIP3_9GAMM|nr:GNAT family N-acyltransferase [Acidihalobacter ferrooxydans]APZ43703.1 hypothetical protein BW247_11875 [Acidihalobacter ferrooxydans]
MPITSATSAKVAATLVAELATTKEQMRESQRLRYRVFARELGAHVQMPLPGHEADRYDHYCHHLLVRDRHSGEVVASTRILTDTQSRLGGGFYSEAEFDFSPVLALPGRIIEIGRTCVAPAYRNGGAISVLWLALARFMVIHRVDYMIGCASIGLRDGGAQAQAITEQLRTSHFTPANLRTRPRDPLPRIVGDRPTDPPSGSLPPLLKAYLRLGARVCGEPCLDRAFNVADLPILLDVDRLDARYRRHFVHNRATTAVSTPIPPPIRTARHAHRATLR